MELKRMSDQELAQRMVNYIERLEQLMREISNYIDKKGTDGAYIKGEYRALKETIRADADYVSKQRNQEGSQLYENYFIAYIEQADAYGFTVPTNGRIDERLRSAVEEAHYRLTKCWSLEQWKEHC